MKKGVFGEVVRMEPTGRPAIGADAMVTCMLPSCWRGCEAHRSQPVDQGVQH
jgi:hypothetical protein